jgi:acetylornithine deacetylase/succinyl-diaminopimelate desuccinylase-like protein
VYGRGAIDMKGHGIIQLMALIAIKRAGMQLDRDLVYIANADEEVNGDGAIIFVKQAPRPAAGCRIPAHRRGGHESRRRQGSLVRHRRGGEASPLDSARSRRKDLPRLGADRRSESGAKTGKGHRASVGLADTAPTHSGGRAVLQGARHDRDQSEGRKYLADPRTALKSPAGRAWLLSEPERNALLRNTISPTVLVGSNKTNTIPQRATAELDIRLLPDEDPAAFTKELRRIIADTSVRAGGDRTDSSPL